MNDDNQTPPVEPEVGTVPVAEPTPAPEPAVDAPPEPTRGLDPATGEPFKETPEDVEKARAYYQTKSQQDTERAKAAEAELEALNVQFDLSDPTQQVQPPPTQPPPAAPVPTYAPPPEPVTQEQEPWDPDQPVTAGQIQAMFATQEQQRVQREQATETQMRQQQSAYDALQYEAQSASTKLREYAKKRGVPEEVVTSLVNEANQYVTGGVPGGPTKTAKLVAKLISSQYAIQQQQATQLAADQTRVTQMGLTAQPPGAAPDTPAATTAQTVNAQLADEIAPDDKPIV